MLQWSSHSESISKLLPWTTLGAKFDGCLMLNTWLTIPNEVIFSRCALLAVTSSHFGAGATLQTYVRTLDGSKELWHPRQRSFIRWLCAWPDWLPEMLYCKLLHFTFYPLKSCTLSSRTKMAHQSTRTRPIRLDLKMTLELQGKILELPELSKGAARATSLYASLPTIQERERICPSFMTWKSTNHSQSHWELLTKPRVWFYWRGFG